MRVGWTVTLTTTISLGSAAEQLAQSGDLIAIGSFLRTLGNEIATLQIKEDDLLRKKAIANLSFNLSLMVNKLADDLQILDSWRW